MADSTVKEWIDTQDNRERGTIAMDMAGSIDLGVMDVPNLLQELQPYLSETSTMIEAADGMNLLATVLNHLQTDLGRSNLHALVEYLCVRLENKDEVPNFRAGVKDTAKSLQALASMTARFPRGDASLAAKAVFSLTSTSLRDQKPPTRLSLFELLDFLAQTYSATLTRDMGPQLFVDGLVSMSASEKDPKCLRLLFQMYEQISQTWTLNDDDYKKIWDSVSKYWPISFREDPSDPSIPTVKELNILIQNCFTSHDKYAAHTFDHLVQVLDTSQDTVTAYTKNTVLETFEACFSAYSTTVAAEWCTRIWDALKFEVWDGTNDEFIDRTLAVIATIVKKLDSNNTDWQSTESPLAKFVVAASTECSQRMHDSKQQHVLGSGQILRALGSTSHISFDLIMRNILPRMLVMWDDTSSRDKKTLLLAVFNHLLQARLDLRDLAKSAIQALLQDPAVFQKLQGGESLVTRSFAKFQQSLVDDVYIPAMMGQNSGDPAVDTPFRINTIKGLVHGARIPLFLSDYHKGTIVSEFSDVVLDRSQKQAIHDEVVSALLQIHIEDPGRFRDITLPKFMAALPNRVSTNKLTLPTEMAGIIFVLEALTKVACTKSCRNDTDPAPPNATTNYKFRVFEFCQRGLMQKMFSILLSPDQLQYVNALLAAMFRSLQLIDEAQTHDEEDGQLVPALFPSIHPYGWIVMELYQKLIKQKEHSHGSLAKQFYMGLSIIPDQDEEVTDMFVHLLGKLTTLALRSNQTTSTNNFLFNMEPKNKPNQVWYLFCEEDPKPFIDSSQQNLEEGPAEKCLTNILSMALVAGVRREDKDKLKIHVGNAAVSMMKGAISTKNNGYSAYERISMLDFLQLLINKFGATKEKVENDGRTLPQVMLELARSCIAKTDEFEIERIYQTLAYFAAACLTSGDRSDKLLIEQMITGMLYLRVGRKVAQSFRILLAPSEYMNQANFCIIRKLRKQRLYGLTVDQLTSQWRQAQNKEQKENIIIALAGIFAYMDPKLLEDQAETIFPLILDGTNVQNDEFAMHTYILLLKELVVSCPDVVSSHVDSIINRMTDRSHNTYDSPSDASVKCRAAALDVLSLMVGCVEKQKLLQRKAKVMVELDVALDDCSRTVRSAAERTKMRWFNLVEVEAKG